MKQTDLGLNLTIKRTRKREFLDEMNRVVPWADLVALVAPFAPEGKKGRPPFAVETMLRICPGATRLASACLSKSFAVLHPLLWGPSPRTSILIQCDSADFVPARSSRPPWTNHPSTVRACGWPLQGPWLDHRSPTPPTA